jgi:hypothetical protein
MKREDGTTRRAREDPSDRVPLALIPIFLSLDGVRCLCLVALEAGRSRALKKRDWRGRRSSNSVDLWDSLPGVSCKPS